MAEYPERIPTPERVPTPEQMLHGLPQPVANPGTVEGYLEQVGKFIAGIRRRRTGWRRAIGRLGLVLITAMVVVLLVSDVLDGY